MTHRYDCPAFFDRARCAGCHTITHIELLDDKAPPGASSTKLLCEKCYGPGWKPLNQGAYDAWRRTKPQG